MDCKELVQSEPSASRTVQIDIEIATEMFSRSEIKISFCLQFVFNDL